MFAQTTLALTTPTHSDTRTHDKFLDNWKIARWLHTTIPHQPIEILTYCKRDENNRRVPPLHFLNIPPIVI